MIFQKFLLTYLKQIIKPNQGKRKRSRRLEAYKKSQKQTFSARASGKIMLWQVKKILHCHFPDLSSRLSAIQDPRKGSIQYSIEELLMSAIVLFLLKYDSRNDFNNRYKDEIFRKNYDRMFALRLPHMDAVNDLLEKIAPQELEDIRCGLISVLIEKRVFHKFRFFGKYFHIAVDATGVYNWGNAPCDAVKEFALTKESSKGKVSHFTNVLEAVLICSNGTSIPLITEWIANDGENYDKQDCESKAFKRLSIRLKKYFPRLNICILADGLYTNVSMMNICKEYGWHFILVFKDGNLPSVWEEVNQLLPLTGMVESHQESFYNSIHRTSRKYRWINGLEYKKHAIQWVECVQEWENIKTGEKKTNRFVFLTGWEVNKDNIASIITAGRGRWFIEDHFNTQKNRGGKLHHKFNRNNFTAIKNWHHIRELTCMIDELVKHTAEIVQLKKENQKLSWKDLYKSLNSYLTMLSIEEEMAEFERWSMSDRQVRLE